MATTVRITPPVDPSEHSLWRDRICREINGLSWVSDGEVAVVDTLAEVKAVTGQQANDVLYMLGRTSAGDGGQGIFRWDSSDLSAEVAADTQSGIYIAPSGESGSGGAWVRQYGYLTPEMFGAVGDGSTDDDTAIYDLFVNFSGEIRLKPGSSYRLAQNTKIILAGDQIIYGNGATFVYDNSTETRRFILRNDNTRWYDVNWYGKTGLLHNGPTVQNSSNHYFTNCTSENMGFYGFCVSENTDTSTGAVCNNLWWINCRAIDCGYFGWELFPKVLSDLHRIINCVAINCGKTVTTGFGFKVGQYTTDFQIVNGTAIDCENGIALSNWEELTVKGFRSVDSRRTAASITIDDWTGGFGTIEASHGRLDFDAIVDERSGFSTGDSTAPAFQISYGTPTNAPREIIGSLDVLAFTGKPWDIKPTNDIPASVKVHFKKLHARNFSVVAAYFRDSNGGVVNNLQVDDMRVDFTGQNDVNSQVVMHTPGAQIKSLTVIRGGQYPLRIKGDGQHYDKINLVECNITAVASRAGVIAEETAANRYDFYSVDVFNGAAGGVTNIFAVSGTGPTFGYGWILSDSAVNLRVNSDPIVVDLSANVTIN